MMIYRRVGAKRHSLVILKTHGNPPNQFYRPACYHLLIKSELQPIGILANLDCKHLHALE